MDSSLSYCVGLLNPYFGPTSHLRFISRKTPVFRLRRDPQVDGLDCLSVSLSLSTSSVFPGCGSLRLLDVFSLHITESVKEFPFDERGVWH